MYALVKTGGKQYRVAKDDTILVERIAAEEGDQVVLELAPRDHLRPRAGSRRLGRQDLVSAWGLDRGPASARALSPSSRFAGGACRRVPRVCDDRMGF